MTPSPPPQRRSRPLPPIPWGAAATPRPRPTVPRTTPAPPPLVIDRQRSASSLPSTPRSRYPQGPPQPPMAHPHTFPPSRGEAYGRDYHRTYIERKDDSSYTMTLVDLDLGETLRAGSSTQPRNGPTQVPPMYREEDPRMLSPARSHLPCYFVSIPEYATDPDYFPSLVVSVPMVRSESLPVLTYAALEHVGGSRSWAQSWSRVATSPVIASARSAESSPVTSLDRDSPINPSPVQRGPVDLGGDEDRTDGPPPPYSRIGAPMGTPSPEPMPTINPLFLRRGRPLPVLSPLNTTFQSPISNDDDDEEQSPTTPTLATYHRRPHIPEEESPTTPRAAVLRFSPAFHYDVELTPRMRPAAPGDLVFELPPPPSYLRNRCALSFAKRSPRRSPDGLEFLTHYNGQRTRD